MPGAQEVPAPTNVPPSSQATVPGAVSTQNTHASLHCRRPGGFPSRRGQPCRRTLPVGWDRATIRSAPHTFRWTASSIRWRCGCIRWATWIRRSSICGHGRAAACCTCWSKSSPAIIASGDDQAIDLLAKLDDYIASEGAEDATTERAFRSRQRLRRAVGLHARDGHQRTDAARQLSPGADDLHKTMAAPTSQGSTTLRASRRSMSGGGFSLYVRGEYQHAPAGTATPPTGHRQSACSCRSCGDACRPSMRSTIASATTPNQATIPAGHIAAQNPFRLQEATLSFHVLGHGDLGRQVRLVGWPRPGKRDELEQQCGGHLLASASTAWSRCTFPGSRACWGRCATTSSWDRCKGHTSPNEPWVHSEMFSFAPTSNFQFAFSRTVIWGGHGHGCLPILPDGNPHPATSRLRSTHSSRVSSPFNDTNGAQKYSVNDPGARYSDFSFSYRLPFVRHHLTLYTDSISHDDVSPISAPRRAAYRPGIYLSAVSWHAEARSPR